MVNEKEKDREEEIEEEENSALKAIPQFRMRLSNDLTNTLTWLGEVFDKTVNFEVRKNCLTIEMLDDSRVRVFHSILPGSTFPETQYDVKVEGCFSISGADLKKVCSKLKNDVVLELDGSNRLVVSNKKAKVKIGISDSEPQNMDMSYLKDEEHDIKLSFPVNTSDLKNAIDILELVGSNIHSNLITIKSSEKRIQFYGSSPAGEAEYNTEIDFDSEEKFIYMMANIAEMEKFCRLHKGAIRPQAYIKGNNVDASARALICKIKIQDSDMYYIVSNRVDDSA